MQTIYTLDQVAQIVADNAKTKQWLNCTFQVSANGRTYGLGVKAYGKWVQRYQVGPFCDGIPEQKSVKLMRELFIGNVQNCLNYLN